MILRNRRTKKVKFTVGEIVKIKPREEIRLNLSPDNKLEGCFFMDKMWEYCGQEVKIVKIVKSFWNNDRMLKCRIPIYILEGLLCDGKIKSFDHQCDRSCFFLWHENWLEKLNQ